MADTIQGKLGTIELNSAINCKIVSWDLSTVVTTTETTGLEDATPTHEPTISQSTISGTGNLIYNAADTAPVPAGAFTGDLDGLKVAFILTETTGCTHSGTCIITNHAFGRDRVEKAVITFSAICTGDVTQTWDETP